MKDLLKIAIVLPLCFNTFLWGQTAKTAEISTFAELKNPNLYDTNTEIKNNIIFQTKTVVHFEKDTPFTIYGAKQYDNNKQFIGYPTINGNKQGYAAGYTPEADGYGTGFGFFKGTNVTIKDLNFTNFTHRQRGTIYLNNSTGTLDNVTMTGFEQYMTDGHIWGSMVAFVDSSLNNVIKNSTFQNVDLKLHISHRGGDVDSDGGVLHIQGSQGDHVQSSGKILNSNFLNNTLTANRNIYGAAVYNEGIISEISGSRFEGNTINATGALTESVKPTINEQMLKTGGFGGALSLGSHYTGRGFATITELKDTQFLNNTVNTNEGYARGGALWSGDDSIIGAIKNCTFTGNSSVSDNGKASGGAIYNNGNIGKIVDSTFKNNFVQSPNGFGDDGAIVMTKFTGAGGAIFTKKDITIQDGTELSGNSVQYVTKDADGNIIDNKKIEVSNDIHLSDSAKLTITHEDKNKNSVSILSGISSKDETSTIKVQGGTTLNLSGVNQFFTGRTNIIENSILNFTQNNGTLDSFVNGTVNIEAGSVVNFANTHTDVNGTVTDLIGGGTFHKTGAGAVIIGDVIKNPNIRFDGHIDLDGGSLTISAAPQTTKGQTDFTANIGDNTTFTYYNGGWSPANGRDDSFTLNNNFNFKFDKVNSGANLKFTGHGTFTVADDIQNALGNTVSMDSATISFGSKEYYGNYSISNSTISLQDDNKITNVIFKNTFTTDTKSTRDYKIDFDFTNTGAFDTITAANGNATLNLSGIKVLNSDKDLGQLAGKTQTYKVLNNVNFLYNTSKNIASDTYTYTASAIAGGTDLILKATGLQADTLYLLNHVKTGQNRYFYFLGNDDYNVGKNLKETLAGNLYVNGKSDNPLDSVITGNNQYSFFQNNDDNSNLVIRNVTLEKARGNNIAAVLDVTAQSGASFDNVVIRNNTTTGGKASAISNDGGTVTLNDVTFTNNTGVASYIYNSGDMTISTTIDRILNNGASGNKITNDTAGTLGFTADTGKTYTIASAIDNSGIINTSGNIVFTDAINNTGNLNVLTNSVVTLTNNSGITGDNGMVDVAGKLLLTGNTSNITINSGFKGNGIIEKSDAVITEINGKNEGFEGQVNVTGGTLKYTKTDNNSFFNQKAVITVDNKDNNNATLDYTTNNPNVIVNSANINLKNNANLIFSGREAGDSVIRINGKILNSDDTSNSYLFEKGDYTLSKEVNFYQKDTGSPDNITFLNAKARFEMDDEPVPGKSYTMGNANWTLDNAEFRFLNKAAGNTYTFNTLKAINNSKISLDLDLTLDKTTGKRPIADTFTANGGDGGVIEIVRIGVTADNGGFDKVLNPATGKYTLSKGVIPIFTDPANKLRIADKNKATILNWGTNVYKYDIKSASSDGNRIADSIEVVPICATTTGTLRELNRYELANGGGNRGFSYIVKRDPKTDAPLSNDYNIYRDLDETAAGDFSVLGTVDAQIGKSILDGELEQVVTKVWESYDKLVEHKDAAGNVLYITYDGQDIYNKATDPTNGHYTYNEDTEEYTIDIEAFTPSGQDKGSMFEIVNNTDFLMRDLVVKNATRYASDVIKDGPVIYARNNAAEIYLQNVDVTNNSTESGNGGAIANYLNKSFTIQDMKADNNTAGGLGGAIYTASNMNIIDSDFGTTGLNYHNKTAQTQEQNDIYIAGKNTQLEYSVSLDKTKTINSGLAGDGQFIKTGRGTLNLNGKNEGLEGLFAVDGGKVVYTKDSASDSFANGDVSLNGELEMAIANALTENIKNVSSDNTNGILTKTGAGTLNLIGNNGGFTGTANINEGTVVYTASAATDSYISGETNIAQSAKLNYIANQTSKLDKVAGEGTINYSGTSELTFNGADNTGFEGVINANGTQLNVTGNQTDEFGINIQKGTLNYTATENANINLGGDAGKIAFAAGTTGATAIFNSGKSFTLGNIQNVINNAVTFRNTTVNTSETSYAVGNYALDNAILSLVNNSTGKVSFENLSALNGSKLSIDVDLGPLYNTPASDILSVNKGSGTLTLTDINVLNSRNNNDNGLNSKYEFNVVEGPLTINKDTSVSKWATNVYEYDVNVNNTGKGIIMSAVKASDADSLKAINQYEGTRGFQFRDGDKPSYVIGSNLGTTAEGIFTVKGTDGTVISGDNKYSFFNVQNQTDLTINNVTITNAYKSDGTGAVINAINSAANIELNNVTLQNNFDKNGKNDIYIEQGAKVIANNSSINSGIAGSGTLDANNLTLSGKNSDFTGTINVTKGLEFTQTDAQDSYISGTTNVGTSSVTLNIDKGDTNAGNFVGAGTLTKTGSKDALITGDNSKFTGNVNINNGSIFYNADDTKYFGGNTILAKDGSLKVTTDNSTDLSKISGAGTLAKDGTGTLRMTGDNSGFNGNLTVNNGIFALAAGSSIGQIANGVFENGTTINLQNTIAVKDNNGNWTTNPAPASIQNLKFDNLTLNGNVGLNLDVDLKNIIADTISSNTVSGNGHLILGSDSINVVSDSLLNDTTVRIASGAVAEGNRILLSNDARTVMGPIQKYGVEYAGGNLEFSRQGGYAPSIDSINPSVMSSVVATQIGGYLTQLQTLQDGFYHMNRYTKYPSAMRFAAERTIGHIAKGNANKETPVSYKSRLAETSQSMWVKPYTSFESIHLRGGANVDAITYGSLYGGDSDLVDLGHGFKGVVSTFVGYNGSQQSFNGISMNQNGGTLGLTGTLYKGNFFTGLTASTGASAGEAYTPYGHDNFSMITAGIANKTGYNWEIKEGKLIVQPSLFLGYTFVNTFDYTNSAGVRIDSDPLNAIQIVPGIKFISNLKNGWQPYIGVDMVWSIIDKTNVMANDVRLPQLSVKPYVQYGVGIQKSWGERFTGFFQTMIRNGGRNGVMLSFGFRWSLGKKPEPIQYTGPKKKKIIREMENL